MAAGAPDRSGDSGGDGHGLRVVLADHHPCVAELLAWHLGRRGAEIVASAADGPAAVEAILTHRPDVAIVDLRLPGLAGLAVVDQVARAGGTTAIVVFATFSDEDTALEALRVGARGCVDKAGSLEELDRAVRIVARGGIYLDGQSDVALRARPERLRPLTVRELDVLTRTSQGRSSREIAAELGVAPSTIRAHLRNAARKLGARNGTHAVARAIRHAIIS